jgi:putative DNA primase/helicase
MFGTNTAVGRGVQDGVYQAAMNLLAAGLSVVPVRADGSKAAAAPWRGLQQRHPTPGELFAWFGGPHPFGPAVIAGRISGNLEIIDCDHAPVWPEFRMLALQRVPPLVDAPVVRTPRDGGGYQLYTRCAEPVRGNLKLATYTAAGGKFEVALETRGEGGYCLSPACPPGCHPNNRPYQLIAGNFDTIPVLTAVQLAELHSIAMTFDERIEQTHEPQRQVSAGNVGRRPGDIFDLEVSWESILGPFGWRLLYADSSGTGYWRRPGKARGVSATTDFRPGLFFNFSSNATPLEAARGYRKFAVFALLRHGGDFNAAARALWK